MQEENYEPVTPEIAIKEKSNEYMKIEDLAKEYDTGLRAVNGINLKLYSD
jgi:hypothetical protein